MRSNKLQNERYAQPISSIMAERDQLKEDNALLIEALKNLPEHLEMAADSLEIQAQAKGCTNVIAPKLKWYSKKITELLNNIKTKQL